MRRATLLLMLSASWPLLAIAADPAPVQADFEPKPLQSTETRATPDNRPLRGPEDFVLPAPELTPRTGKEAGPQDRAPNPNAPVLEGF
jgi:hypothetical protein